MDELIERFCPPLDEPMLRAIAGEYDLSEKESLATVVEILETLKVDVEVLEAATDVQAMAVDGSGKDVAMKSTASESIDGGGPSETDASSVAPFDGLSAQELRSRLKDMFQTCTMEEIERVLEHTTSAETAMDELLNAMFYKETPELEEELRYASTAGSEADDAEAWESVKKKKKPLPRSSKDGLFKGVEGFAVEEDYVPSRKANARRNKQHKPSPREWLMSDSSTTSEGPAGPVMTLHSPSVVTRNAWTQVKEDVDFLAEYIDLPRGTLQSAYHSHSASLSQTLLYLVRENSKKQHEEGSPDSLERFDNIASQLSVIIPELNYNDIISLCQISKEGGWSATHLIMLLAEAQEESLIFIPSPTIPQVVEVDSNWGAVPAKRGKGSSASSEQAGTIDLGMIDRQYVFNLQKATTAGNSAHDLWRRGRSDKTLLPAATVYSEERRVALGKMQQLASQWAEAIAERQSGIDWIDLHGINSADAKRIVRRKVPIYWRYLEDTSERTNRGPLRGYYRIVTGKGLHSSTGRGVLGPTISKMLVKDGWKISVLDGELAVVGKN